MRIGPMVRIGPPFCFLEQISSNLPKKQLLTAETPCFVGELWKMSENCCNKTSLFANFFWTQEVVTGAQREWPSRLFENGSDFNHSWIYLSSPKKHLSRIFYNLKRRHQFFFEETEKIQVSPEPPHLTSFPRPKQNCLPGFFCSFGKLSICFPVNFRYIAKDHHWMNRRTSSYVSHTTGNSLCFSMELQESFC